jgi:hypothetical protein
MQPKSRRPLSPVYWIAIVFGILTFGLFSLRDKPAAQPGMPQSEFASVVGHINVGTEVYISDTQKHVGTIKSVSEAHAFSDGTKRQGVQIQFEDGSDAWMPRDAVKKLYLVKASQLQARK